LGHCEVQGGNANDGIEYGEVALSHWISSKVNPMFVPNLVVDQEDTSKTNFKKVVERWGRDVYLQAYYPVSFEDHTRF